MGNPESAVRQGSHRVLHGLEFLGVQLDDDLNRAAGPDAPARLGRDDAPVSVWLIPADEERQIAREVFELLRGDTA
jgi:acetate kinase